MDGDPLEEGDHMSRQEFEDNLQGAVSQVLDAFEERIVSIPSLQGVIGLSTLRNDPHVGEARAHYADAITKAIRWAIWMTEEKGGVPNNLPN